MAKKDTPLQKDTPLHEALRKGDFEKALKFIEQGKHIHDRGAYNLTPLHLSAAYGQIKLIETLFEKGAKIEAKDISGYTPLHIATSQGEIEAIKNLLGKKAKIEAKNKLGQTPFHIAVIFERIEAVKILLNKGADKKATDKVGRSSLHFAVMGDNTAVTKEILTKNSQPNVRDKNGWTPLHLASFDGRPEMVRCLIEKGAFVNAETYSSEWVVWGWIAATWIILVDVLWASRLLTPERFFVSGFEIFAALLVPVVIFRLLTRPANLFAMVGLFGKNTVKTENAEVRLSSFSDGVPTKLQKKTTLFRIKGAFFIFTPLDVAHHRVKQIKGSIKGHEGVIEILERNGGKAYHSGSFNLFKGDRKSENGGAEKPKDGDKK